MTTLPAGEQHTGNLNLTGEGNEAKGSGISDAAVEAASNAYLVRRYPNAGVDANLVRPQSHDFAMRAALEAAAPAIRQQVAEEIAVVLAEFLGKPAGEIAAEITRKLGRGESL